MPKSLQGASPIPQKQFSLSVGDRYGKWTVLEVPLLAPGEKIWHARPLCRCDCGATHSVDVQSFVHGRSKGCKSCSIKGRFVTHNDSCRGSGQYKRLYRIWQGMLKRCYGVQQPAYPRYGGRGITVCDEWIKSYPAFREWALANGYADHLTIDRFPDKNGNYEPGNCRWATPRQQAFNTNANRMLHAFGESKPMGMWAEDERCAVNLHTLNTRISRGWSEEWAIKAPVRSPKR